MKVWRQAFGVQRVPTTLNAQPLQTLNLPIMAAQPQSSRRQRGHPSCATPNAQRRTLNLPMVPSPRLTARMTNDLGPCGPCMNAACGG
ncbi:MAG: hypothetical protein M0Q87_10100 [Ottowia sp.]|nr:hypothetical protein [Ottowia sp.]